MAPERQHVPQPNVVKHEPGALAEADAAEAAQQVDFGRPVLCGVDED